jgi:outer membrane protein, heavy metal efflux system
MNAVAALASRLASVALLSAFVVTFAGCVTYRPQPLASDDVEAVLASPNRDVLTRAASQLSHPRLAPITLDFSRPLSADEVAVIAVLANPDLRALRTQQQVADAQSFKAGLLPDPQLSLGFDQVLSPSDPALSTGWAAGLTFDLLGPLATRRTERQVAEAAAQQVRLDIAWQELATAGQARLLALRVDYQREAAQLARVASDTAQHALRRSLAAAVAGDLKRDDVEAQRIAAADNMSRALAAERDYGATQLELRRTLGLKPHEALELAPPTPLSPWHAFDADALFANARRDRLDLQALEAGYASQEGAVHRAVLGQYPRLAITLNRARDTSAVQTFGPAVSLDVPLWNRNRGEVAVAEADRARLHAEYATRLHQTRSDIAVLIAGLDRDEQARTVLATELPETDKTAALLEAAAARGDITLPLAESARAAATDKRLSLIALEQSCAEQRLALVLAVGGSLTEGLQP